MSTAHQIYAGIGLLCLVLAGGFAIRGWLVNLPEGAARYWCRFACWVALTGDGLTWIALDHGRAWWHYGIDCLWLWLAVTHVQQNWKLLEAHRKLERLQSWRKVPR